MNYVTPDEYSGKYSNSLKKNKNDEQLNKSKILLAVEDSRYKGRTIKGISRTVGLEIKEVKRLLNNEPELKLKIMKVPRIKKNNEPIYVTVDKYKNNTSIPMRILNILRGGK